MASKNSNKEKQETSPIIYGNMASKNSNKQKQETSPIIYGDALEAILSHVPLIYLAPASLVSKTWYGAASSSLRYINSPKPWLIIHSQSTRSHAITTTRAYDPRSNLWIKIESGQSIKNDTILKSSNSNLIYFLSASKFSFSMDPLHLKWHHAAPPKVSPVDPIVVVVGHHIIVAGGSYEFEDDPLAVEIYDPDSATWTKCESMPRALLHYSSSTSVSTTTDGSSVFITDKYSGVTNMFDTKTKVWSQPLDLCQDHHDNFYYVTSFVNGCLIFIGLWGDVNETEGIKLWTVIGEGLVEIGEMPKGLIEMESFPFCSINVRSAGNFLYICCNTGMVVCEFVGGSCKWRKILNSATMGWGIVRETKVFSCSLVGIDDIHNALKSENRRFTPIAIK